MDRNPRARITLLLILVQVLISTKAEADSATVNAADSIKAKKFDYVFLLDGSTSTGRKSFEKAKQFLKTFIRRQPKGMNECRFAIIQFSSNEIKTELNFEESIGGADLDKIISNITFEGGKKSTLGGLETATAKFQDQGRLSYRAAMILSDGKENEELPADVLKVDLLFMMDITKTMASIIEVMKQKVVNMAQAIKTKYPAAMIRIGVIGYRDQQQVTAERLVKLDFSTNIEYLKRWMKKYIVARSDSLNNDDPEFVIGAWMEVKNLKWSAPLTRILVHIGDAPSELWSNNKTRGETYIKRVMETLRCRLKISKYLYLKPNHVSGGEKNLREFIDTIKVLSNMECKKYSLLTGENKWFIEKPINTSNLTDIIVEQAKDTIEGMSYANISRALNELGVNLIAIGISAKADSSKVQYITGATFLHYNDTNPNKTAELVTQEIAKDICADCKNGVCIKNGGCECNSGFAGLNCADIDECATNPCDHGSCQDEINGYHCNCEPGYSGINCDTDIDGCASDPCDHGRCQDKVNSYFCECELGYNGKKCDKNIDECATNPCNHGSCQDKINGYHCNCEPGYTGTNCDTDIDGCASDPCKHGRCQDKVNDYFCECELGYSGKNCDINDKCPPPEVKGIRLVHGDTLYDGVLEIYKDGRWYTLCATYFGWSEYARGKKLDRMACKQLKYGKPKKDQKPFAGKSGLPIKDIHKLNPQCFGNEDSLQSCRWIKNNLDECEHGEEVYLKCEEPTQVCNLKA